MGRDAPTPTLAQFEDACRREFTFLRDLGYAERPAADPEDRFTMCFSNGTLTLCVRGENWGQHAGVSLVHADGREAPVWWFVPVAERGTRPTFDPTGYSQLDDIRVSALVISRHCRDVLAGDTARFDAVAHEWRRVRDADYRRSFQPRKLP